MKIIWRLLLRWLKHFTHISRCPTLQVLGQGQHYHRCSCGSRLITAKAPLTKLMLLPAGLGHHFQRLLYFGPVIGYETWPHLVLTSCRRSQHSKTRLCLSGKFRTVALCQRRLLSLLDTFHLTVMSGKNQTEDCLNDHLRHHLVCPRVTLQCRTVI